MGDNVNVINFVIRVCGGSSFLYRGDGGIPPQRGEKRVRVVNFMYVLVGLERYSYGWYAYRVTAEVYCEVVFRFSIS